MPEREINLHIGNDTKLEYDTKAFESGAGTRIYGLTSVPDIGGEPNEVDTTSLDNTKYETSMYGLRPAVKLQYEFNMEDPNANANFNVVSGLEDTGNTYYWVLTYSNGVVIKYRSKVFTDIKATSSGELLKFGMYHAPMEEITKVIPTGGEG